MRDVYVVGAYTTVFKKHPGMSFADLAREAYLGTLADAGMSKMLRFCPCWPSWQHSCAARRARVRSRVRRSPSPRMAATRALFEDEIVRAFHGFTERAKRKLVAVHAASRLEDLRVPPSNRLEKLRGDLDGFYSIRINDQWRIIFRWTDGDAHDVQIIDYH